MPFKPNVKKFSRSNMDSAAATAEAPQEQQQQQQYIPEQIGTSNNPWEEPNDFRELEEGYSPQLKAGIFDFQQQLGEAGTSMDYAVDDTEFLCDLDNTNYIEPPRGKEIKEREKRTRNTLRKIKRKKKRSVKQIVSLNQMVIYLTMWVQKSVTKSWGRIKENYSQSCNNIKFSFHKNSVNSR